jgi:hypothetical protein
MIFVVISSVQSVKEDVLPSLFIACTKRRITALS